MLAVVQKTSKIPRGFSHHLFFENLQVLVALQGFEPWFDG